MKTTITAPGEGFEKPSLKISYLGSGVKTLSILGRICYVFAGLSFLAGLVIAAVDGYYVVILYGIAAALLLFATGVVFTIIAEVGRAAVYQTHVIKSEYNVVEE